jgi:hypothetical protein
MELQPFGPVEQAIQKSAAPEFPKHKIVKSFLLGVVVTLSAIGVVWLIIDYRGHKKDNKQKGNTDFPNSTR